MGSVSSIKDNKILYNLNIITNAQSIINLSTKTIYIMSIQPFTPAGLTAKQTELHALSDSDLKIQANSLRNNITVFMGNHFSFTPTQSAYLDLMLATAQFGLGDTLATILAARGTITMSVIPDNEDHRPKELKATIAGEIRYVDGPTPTYTSTISAHIDWLLH